MKPLSDENIGTFEELALDSVKQLRAYFIYQGTDPRPFQKARLATGAISAYARLRASETNRMAVELAAGKSIQAQPAPRALKSASRR
jgi:hypothetical protein